MPRRASDIVMPSNQNWPPAGWCTATCVKAERWSSPKKGTPAVMLTFVTFDGDYSFDDPIFVTEKAVPRMNLVAQRLCGMPKETELPDSDKEAASVLAKYILEFAYNKTAKVLVEVNMETFLYQDGPKMGQKGERERHKVAFAGYDIVESTSQPSPSADPAPPADDMVDPLADDIPPAPSRQAAQPQQQPQQAADDPFAGDDIPY